jgi:hypothetical protein
MSIGHKAIELRALVFAATDSKIEVGIDQTPTAAMVGRTDKQHFGFGGSSVKQVTFNLARPISLVKSHENSGIQIADVIAAAVAYGLKYPKRVESREWLMMADEYPLMHEESILPNMNQAIDGPNVALNVLLLKDLVRRSRAGEELLVDIEDFLRSPFPNWRLLARHLQRRRRLH